MVLMGITDRDRAWSAATMVNHVFHERTSFTSSLDFLGMSLCQVDQLFFLPNAHGLHGGKISHRVNARFPMQSPLAQEVPAGGWESPGVRWPVARSCSKISALLFCVTPNGAFWQEPSICLCRQVFDCTIPDSNWCPLLFAWYFGQSGILKTVVDSFETWPWRTWLFWAVSVVLWWAYGTKIWNSKSPSTGTLPGKERSTHPPDGGATLANPADFWMCMS